jgi:hypothetical protein
MGGPDRQDDEIVKKDQHGVRDALQEVEEETPEGAVKPKVEQVNRDRARGDWDRSGGKQES